MTKAHWVQRVHIIITFFPRVQPPKDFLQSCMLCIQHQLEYTAWVTIKWLAHDLSNPDSMNPVARNYTNIIHSGMWETGCFVVADIPRCVDHKCSAIKQLPGSAEPDTWHVNSVKCVKTGFKSLWAPNACTGCTGTTPAFQQNSQFSAIFTP